MGHRGAQNLLLSPPDTLPLGPPAQDSYRLFILILPSWHGGAPTYSAKQGITSLEPALGAALSAKSFK